MPRPLPFPPPSLTPSLARAFERDLDLVAQHNRQLDNQRFTMTPRKEDQVELTTLMAAIERSGQKRMDEQRSESPNELRERRLSQVEAIVERQQQRSLTNQRYELTPERLAQMTVSELVHYVVDMNRMGYEVPSPFLLPYAHGPHMY